MDFALQHQLKLRLGWNFKHQEWHFNKTKTKRHKRKSTPEFFCVWAFVIYFLAQSVCRNSFVLFPRNRNCHLESWDWGNWQLSQFLHWKERETRSSFGRDEEARCLWNILHYGHADHITCPSIIIWASIMTASLPVILVSLALRQKLPLWAHLFSQVFFDFDDTFVFFLPSPFFSRWCFIPQILSRFMS